jgi:Fe-S-cluster containining protein
VPKASRRDLERHAIAVQRTVRTCGGCGQCCTEAYNAVRILPVEAARVAHYLDTLPPAHRDRLLRRARETVERYGLRGDGPKVRYTCPFLEDDLGCALPLHVKPTACLSFNPVDPDRCEQEPAWYFPVHDREERENRRAGFDARDAPIPVALLAAVRDRPDPCTRARVDSRRQATAPASPRTASGGKDPGERLAEGEHRSDTGPVGPPPRRPRRRDTTRE